MSLLQDACTEGCYCAENQLCTEESESTCRPTTYYRLLRSRSPLSVGGIRRCSRHEAMTDWQMRASRVARTCLSLLHSNGWMVGAKGPGRWWSSETGHIRTFHMVKLVKRTTTKDVTRLEWHLWCHRAINDSIAALIKSIFGYLYDRPRSHVTWLGYRQRYDFRPIHSRSRLQFVWNGENTNEGVNSFMHNSCNDKYPWQIYNGLDNLEI